MSICNMDCFNCVHPDCINNKIDKEEGLTKTEINRKRRNSSYYEQHKEEQAERMRKWRAEHPDYRKKYYQKNKQWEIEKQKERNKSEEYKTYQREYKRRKAEELRNAQ